MVEELRIMIAAGGTGGHVFPAIAIADAIREKYPEAKILFVGTRDRMEWGAVPRAGYEITPIWISGFHRRLTLKNLLFPLKLLVSLWQSRRLVRSFRPDAMISCGGFASGPAGWVAARYGVPLFLQEQNSYPGVTNRKLAPSAELIFTAFEDAGKWFPKEKTRFEGNPVRKSLMDDVRDPAFRSTAFSRFGFKPDRPVLLVMGGSGGAKSINEAMFKHLETLHDSLGIQIIWQCGEHYLKELETRRNSSGNTPADYPDLRLYGFMEEVSRAWAAADLIISRAGATTCAELMATGKAGILVPSPWVAGDHQTHNARALSDRGAAVLLKDKDLDGHLADTVAGLIRDESQRKEMEKKAAGMARKNAASSIARHILDYISKSSGPKNNPGTHNQTQTITA